MAKIPGKGAVLQLQRNSTYETIAYGVEIAGWTGTNTPINTTILESSAQRTEGTAIPDYGEITWTGFLDASSTVQVAVAAAFSGGATTNAWRMSFADTDTSLATFVGPVTGYNISGVVQDSMVQAQFTIKIDNGVTFST